MTRLHVLVIGETSGTVRRAFAARGHEAWSLDLMPAEDGETSRHIIADARLYIPDYTARLRRNEVRQPFDLVIAHPPCDHLASSGARWFHQKRLDGRQQAAISLFCLMYYFPAPHSCIENPVGIMSSVLRPPNQYIQPYQFGHPESKKTGLWLYNLPPLEPTNTLPLPERGYWDNQTPSGQNKLGPSSDRARIRSRTYAGIAEAMADQWPLAIARKWETESSQNT